MHGTAPRDVARIESFGWAVIDAAPDGVIVVEDGGRVVLANRRADEIFGYDRGELLSVSADDLVPVFLRAAHRAHRDRNSAIPRPNCDSRRLKGVRRDGSHIEIEIALSPVYDESGRIIVATVRLVPNRDAHELELIRSAEARLLDLAETVIDGLQRVALTLITAEKSADAHEVVESFDRIIADVRKTVFDHRLQRGEPPRVEEP